MTVHFLSLRRQVRLFCQHHLCSSNKDELWNIVAHYPQGHYIVSCVLLELHEQFMAVCIVYLTELCVAVYSLLVDECILKVAISLLAAQNCLNGSWPSTLLSKLQ